MMIYERIESILHEDFKVEEVSPDMLIREDLDLDSIGVLELIMALEEEFDIQVDDNQVDDILTLQDVADYIEKVKA